MEDKNKKKSQKKEEKVVRIKAIINEKNEFELKEEKQPEQLQLEI